MSLPRAAIDGSRGGLSTGLSDRALVAALLPYRAPMPDQNQKPFFEPLPPPPPQEQRERVYPSFAWEPPHNVVPVPLAVSLELARTEDTVLVLTGLEAYPQGLSYRIRLWIRPGTENHAGPEAQSGYDSGPRQGWLLEDGTRVGASPDFGPGWPPQASATGAADTYRVGSGNAGFMSDIEGELQRWLYPLPPGARWTVVVEWPARGIPETRVPFDASPVQAAAGASAGELWEMPPTPEDQEYGWFAYAPPWAGQGWPPSSTQRLDDETGADS